jgi:hypothetical protein
MLSSLEVCPPISLYLSLSRMMEEEIEGREETDDRQILGRCRCRSSTLG